MDPWRPNCSELRQVLLLAIWRYLMVHEMDKRKFSASAVNEKRNLIKCRMQILVIMFKWHAICFIILWGISYEIYATPNNSGTFAIIWLLTFSNDTAEDRVVRDQRPLTSAQSYLRTSQHVPRIIFIPQINLYGFEKQIFRHILILFKELYAGGT
jgi:hypothetical protein